MKVIKPFKLGILPRSYSVASEHYFCVATIAFFNLGRNERFVELAKDHAAWPAFRDILPTGTVLDFGLRKLRGEVLLAGSAYAPSQTPTSETLVRLKLAGVDKYIRVIGDRYRQYGLLPLYQETEPTPFLKMPLTMDRAFGGPGYSENLVGRGYHQESMSAPLGSNRGLLPNLELPGYPIRADRSSYSPATFLPQAFDSPDRIRRAGTYDQVWFRRDFPGLARDVDWGIFNVAPEDQQLRPPGGAPPFFQGGESYRLENLHLTVPVLTGRLPSIRARTFLRAENTPFREAPNTADTVWFFPEANLGAMLFHATFEVERSDASDVSIVMVAYEAADSEPRAISHYQAVMDLRSDRKTSGLHAFNESQLCPSVSTHAQQPGSPDPRSSGEVSAITRPSREAIAAGDFDLTATVEGALAHARAVQARAEREKARIAANATGQTTANPNIEELVAQALKRATPPQKVPSFTQIKRKPNAAAAEAIGTALGSMASSALRDGQSLAMRDLTGVCLTDVDLRDCDLTGASLAHARLRHVRARGAKLADASLQGAILENVELDGADLSNANFRQTRMDHVSLTRATLKRSQWLRAEVKGCDFSDAMFDSVTFIRCECYDCSFVRARFHLGSWVQTHTANCSWAFASFQQLSFLECTLSGANFGESSLERVSLLGVNATETRFDRARLTRTLMGNKSRIAGASFRGAVICNCGFRGSILQGSDFQGATLSSCDLGHADIRSCNFDKALISRCGLREAQAQQGSFRETDFFDSVLTAGQFDEAKLDGASLYGAEANGASWHHASLRGVVSQPASET